MRGFIFGIFQRTHIHDARISDLLLDSAEHLRATNNKNSDKKRSLLPANIFSEIYAAVNQRRSTDGVHDRFERHFNCAKLVSRRTVKRR
jgi:hypothetical protein